MTAHALLRRRTGHRAWISSSRSRTSPTVAISAEARRVEVQLRIDLVLDPKRQLGEVERTKPDLAELGGLLVGKASCPVPTRTWPIRALSSVTGQSESWRGGYRSHRYTERLERAEPGCRRAGKRTVLRPAQHTDVATIRAWRNQPANREVSINQHEISPEEHQEWWDRTKDDPQRRVLIFEADGRPLGVVNFFDLDLRQASRRPVRGGSSSTTRRPSPMARRCCCGRGSCPRPSPTPSMSSGSRRLQRRGACATTQPCA